MTDIEKLKVRLLGFILIVLCWIAGSLVSISFSLAKIAEALTK